MGNDIKISASILSAKFNDLQKDIKKCEESGVDLFHIDVMDGHFVPNITIGPVVIKDIRPLTKLPLDAHLMIENPSMYIDAFLDAGCDIISIHAECYGSLREHCRGLGKYPKEVDAINASKVREDIQKIKARGKKVFMVLNPGTPFCLQPVLSDLDGILVMSVNPGFAGQKFMPAVLEKIQEIRGVFDRDIVVDGGVNELSAPEVVKAGANVLATASYLFKSENMKKLVGELKSLS